MDSWHSLSQPQAALIAGLIGACGALLAGLLATTLTQFLTFLGQDKRRWEETRRSAYARMYRAVMAAWDAYDEAGKEPEEWATVGESRAEIRDAYTEAALLVRHRRTDRALDDVYDASSYLWARRGRGWEQVDRHLYDAQARFLEAVRKELRMPALRSESYEEYKAAFRGTSPYSPPQPDIRGAGEPPGRAAVDQGVIS
ncbi:hypothetical protein [Verrucosispora sp. NA02020]|uniref:hypothetical protein n=1 Tax=Verrucosispora sp. NA02020 TaxID=2742132 RepID=UPI0015918217|nr:hypothetical protein [Verrucosispora sp. NA02020]QKW14259.1 hypothetical protein HUT12_16710 [Verrucosispora sp. NA02020]